MHFPVVLKVAVMGKTCALWKLCVLECLQNFESSYISEISNQKCSFNIRGSLHTIYVQCFQMEAYFVNLLTVM